MSTPFLAPVERPPATPFGRVQGTPSSLWAVNRGINPALYPARSVQRVDPWHGTCPPGTTALEGTCWGCPRDAAEALRSYGRTYGIVSSAVSLAPVEVRGRRLVVPVCAAPVATQTSSGGMCPPAAPPTRPSDVKLTVALAKPIPAYATTGAPVKLVVRASGAFSGTVLVSADGDATAAPGISVFDAAGIREQTTDVVPLTAGVLSLVSVASGNAPETQMRVATLPCLMGWTATQSTPRIGVFTVTLTPRQSFLGTVTGTATGAGLAGAQVAQTWSASATPLAFTFAPSQPGTLVVRFAVELGGVPHAVPPAAAEVDVPLAQPAALTVTRDVDSIVAGSGQIVTYTLTSDRFLFGTVDVVASSPYASPARSVAVEFASSSASESHTASFAVTNVDGDNLDVAVVPRSAGSVSRIALPTPVRTLTYFGNVSYIPLGTLASFTSTIWSFTPAAPFTGSIAFASTQGMGFADVEPAVWNNETTTKTLTAKPFASGARFTPSIGDGSIVVTPSGSGPAGAAGVDIVCPRLLMAAIAPVTITCTGGGGSSTTNVAIAYTIAPAGTFIGAVTLVASLAGTWSASPVVRWPPNPSSPSYGAQTLSFTPLISGNLNISATAVGNMSAFVPPASTSITGDISCTSAASAASWWQTGGLVVTVTALGSQPVSGTMLVNCTNASVSSLTLVFNNSLSASVAFTPTAVESGVMTPGSCAVSFGSFAATGAFALTAPSPSTISAPISAMLASTVDPALYQRDSSGALHGGPLYIWDLANADGNTHPLGVGTAPLPPDVPTLGSYTVSVSGAVVPTSTSTQTIAWGTRPGGPPAQTAGMFAGFFRQSSTDGAFGCNSGALTITASSPTGNVVLSGQTTLTANFLAPSGNAQVFWFDAHQSASSGGTYTSWDPLGRSYEPPYAPGVKLAPAVTSNASGSPLAFTNSSVVGTSGGFTVDGNLQMQAPPQWTYIVVHRPVTTPAGVVDGLLTLGDTGTNQIPCVSFCAIGSGYVCIFTGQPVGGSSISSYPLPLGGGFTSGSWSIVELYVDTENPSACFSRINGVLVTPTPDPGKIGTWPQYASSYRACFGNAGYMKIHDGEGVAVNQQSPTGLLLMYSRALTTDERAATYSYANALYNTPLAT